MRAVSRLKKTIAIMLLSGALMATPAPAQVNTAERTAESGAEKPGLLIWQWVNFAILVGVLGWIASKQGGPYLSARARGISEGLAAGEKAKAEADARSKSVNDRLANLKNEIADIRSKAREEREREADRIRRDTAVEIARLRAHAEQELESAGKQARLDVQRFAAALAIELAEQKVKTGMTGEVQAALIDRFMRDLPGDIPHGAMRARPSQDEGRS